MRQFVSYARADYEMRAWINPEDPNDEVVEPHIFKPGGWRVVVERVNEGKVLEIIRSTWEQTVEEAVEHVRIRWPEEPKWFDYETEEPVQLST